MSFPKIRSRDKVLAEIEAEDQRELAAARSTISEQEKRIAELEAENAHANGVAIGTAVALNQTRQALTSERQRREEAERALRPFADIPQGQIPADPLYHAPHYRDARLHFRKYEASKRIEATGMQAIFQVATKGLWSDVTKDTYDAFCHSERRIVYVGGPPPEGKGR